MLRVRLPEVRANLPQKQCALQNSRQLSAVVGCVIVTIIAKHCKKVYVVALPEGKVALQIEWPSAVEGGNQRRNKTLSEYPSTLG